MDDEDLTLDEVEAEIARCEALLARDVFSAASEQPAEGNASHEDASSESPVDAAASASAVSPAPAAVAAASRASDSPGSSGSAPRDYVREGRLRLLSERSHASTSPSSGSGASGVHSVLETLAGEVVGRHANSSTSNAIPSVTVDLSIPSASGDVNDSSAADESRELIDASETVDESIARFAREMPRLPRQQSVRDRVVLRLMKEREATSRSASSDGSAHELSVTGRRRSASAAPDGRRSGGTDDGSHPRLRSASAAPAPRRLNLSWTSGDVDDDDDDDDDNENRSPAHRSSGKRPLTIPQPFNLSGESPRRARAADVRARVEAERAAETPFKPTLIARSPRQRRRDNNASSSEASESVWKRLQQPQQQRAGRSYAAEREERELASCTFQPQLTSRRPGTVLSRADSNLPVHERLFRKANRPDPKLAQRLAAAKREAAAEYTFKPAVLPSTRAYQQRAGLLDEQEPLHARVPDQLREREARLTALRAEVTAANTDLTFAPVISSRSKRLAAARAQRGEDDAPHHHKHELVEQAHRANPVREPAYQFQPRLHPNTKRILEGSEVYAQTDFLARQEIYEQRQQEHAAMQRLEQQQAADAHRFQLSQRSRQLVLRRLQRLQQQRQAHLVCQKEALAHSGKDGRVPAINARSRRLAAGRTMQHLIRDSVARPASPAVQAAQQEFQQRHPFQPTILTKQSQALVSERARAARIVDWSNPEVISEKLRAFHQRRAARELAAQREREAKELAECTFAPKLAARPATDANASDASAPVRGLQKHLWRSVMAKAKEADLQARRRKVFLEDVHRKHVRPASFTIPRPFHLSSDPDAQARRAELREALEQSEMAECTFRPDTWVSRKQALLDDILSTPD